MNICIHMCGCAFRLLPLHQNYISYICNLKEKVYVGGCMGWCGRTTVYMLAQVRRQLQIFLCSPLSWKTKIGKVRRQNISCHHSRFWLNNVYTFRLLTSGLSSVVFPGPCNEHEGTGFCLQIALCP